MVKTKIVTTSLAFPPPVHVFPYKSIEWRHGWCRYSIDHLVVLALHWVNPSKRGRMDGVFRGLAGLLRGISWGRSPREIPRSSAGIRNNVQKLINFQTICVKVIRDCPKYGERWSSQFGLVFRLVFFCFFYEMSSLTKGGGGVRQILTLADKGGRGAQANADIGWQRG